MYEDIEKFKYHCFTDNKDEWAKDNKAVKEIVRAWKIEGYTNFRIYNCIWEEVEGIYNDVDCIYSTGDYPV